MNLKSYKKNGYECSMCPFTGTNTITQFAYSSYSHAGSTAIDVAQSAGVKAAYYAPATIKCVKIDTHYCFTWWQTVNKVWQPNGILDYATYMFGHDETINSYVGQVLNQGVQVGNMGAGGNATGVHCHLETAQGLQNGWIPNRHGVYVLPNASLIENVCFMDDTNFTNMNKDPLHYTSEIQEESEGSKQPILNCIPDDFLYENATFQCTVDIINIRKAPSLQGELTEDWYENGMCVNYDGYVRREGYVWISWVSSKTGNRHWMVAGELTGNVNTTPYGTFH